MKAVRSERKLEYVIVNAAEQWHREVSHLVQAHGADPGQLLAYVFCLGEVRWAHFDTHAALMVVGLRPPDGHLRPARADACPPMTIPSPYTAPASTLTGDGDWGGFAALRYRPFPSSPEILAGPFERFRRDFPISEYTGLPQTELRPRADADLADWAAGSMRVLDEICAEYEGDPSVMDRTGTFRLKRERITQFAEAAAARWLARAAAPTAQAPPGTRHGRAAPAAEWRLATDPRYVDRPGPNAHIDGMDLEAGC